MYLLAWYGNDEYVGQEGILDDPLVLSYDRAYVKDTSKKKSWEQD